MTSSGASTTSATTSAVKRSPPSGTATIAYLVSYSVILLKFNWEMLFMLSNQTSHRILVQTDLGADIISEVKTRAKIVTSPSATVVTRQ